VAGDRRSTLRKQLLRRVVPEPGLPRCRHSWSGDALAVGMELDVVTDAAAESTRGILTTVRLILRLRQGRTKFQNQEPKNQNQEPNSQNQNCKHALDLVLGIWFLDLPPHGYFWATGPVARRTFSQLSATKLPESPRHVPAVSICSQAWNSLVPLHQGLRSESVYARSISTRISHAHTFSLYSKKRASSSGTP